MRVELGFHQPGGVIPAAWAGAARGPAFVAYVCQVTGRGTIPRRNRAQLRGAERYTEAHNDEGVYNPDGNRL